MAGLCGLCVVACGVNQIDINSFAIRVSWTGQYRLIKLNFTTGSPCTVNPAQLGEGFIAQFVLVGLKSCC